MIEFSFEIFSNGMECWYKDGAYHREGEHPAVIHPDGAKEYLIEGQLKKVVKSNGVVIHVNDDLDNL
jgi:hypothetical protein